MALRYPDSEYHDTERNRETLKLLEETMRKYPNTDPPRKLSDDFFSLVWATLFLTCLVMAILIELP